MNKAIFDNRVERIHSIISPKEMLEKLPLDENSYPFILESRKVISDIINQKDERFLLIVGPCSVHDTKAAEEYASRLAELRKKYSDKFFIVMRAYLEKPRTALGWRGLIVEPDLNGLINISAGLEKARKFLIKLIELRMPTAVELLDQVVPQYLADLITWASIGARSAESQMHRELASGLSMPVGFKNTTAGDIESAINGIIVSREEHAFISVERNGKSAIIYTKGNPDSHLILRGGKNIKNCDEFSILNTLKELKEKNINSGVLVDCSHGNSQRHIERQIENLHDLVSMRFSKTNPIKGIRGCMLESFLQAGSCEISECKKTENYGCSITDPCLSWEMTKEAIAQAYKIAKQE